MFDWGHLEVVDSNVSQKLLPAVVGRLLLVLAPRLMRVVGPGQKPGRDGGLLRIRLSYGRLSLSQRKDCVLDQVVNSRE
jgi:hypothetical protein